MSQVKHRRTLSGVSKDEEGNVFLTITQNDAKGSIVTQYQFVPIPEGWDCLHLCRRTFALVMYRIDDRTFAPTLACNCPDAQHRPASKFQCKHVAALRKALDILF